MRWLLVILLCTLAVGFVGSCSDPASSKSAGKRVQVVGTVYGLWCPDGPNPSDLRYSVTYQRSATVKVIGGAMTGHEYQTDSLSVFRFDAVADTFSLVVETPHSWPDTFRNIVISADTNLQLVTSLNFYPADTLSLTFFYPDAADSLGPEREMRCLNNLERYTRSDFDLEQSVRGTYLSGYSGWYHVTYKFPVRPSRPFWQTIDAVNSALHDTMRYYRYVSINNLFHICFDAATRSALDEVDPIEQQIVSKERGEARFQSLHQTQ